MSTPAACKTEYGHIWAIVAWNISILFRIAVLLPVQNGNMLCPWFHISNTYTNPTTCNIARLHRDLSRFYKIWSNTRLSYSRRIWWSNIFCPESNKSCLSYSLHRNMYGQRLVCNILLRHRAVEKRTAARWYIFLSVSHKRAALYSIYLSGRSYTWQQKRPTNTQHICTNCCKKSGMETVNAHGTGRISTPQNIALVYFIFSIFWGRTIYPFILAVAPAFLYAHYTSFSTWSLGSVKKLSCMVDHIYLGRVWRFNGCYFRFGQS